MSCDVLDARGVRAPEVAQPAPVVLGLQREAPVLEPAVDAHHVVVDLLDGDAGAEEVGREDDAAVREPDLAVLDAVRARLALLVLGAVRVVRREPRRQVLVVVVVAEGPVEAELARRGQPLQHERRRVDRVVDLRRAHAERAQVVAEHRHVLELGGELALQPDPGRVGAAEELVRGQAVVDAQPVRELALGAAHAGKARDPGPERHVAVEHVAQVAGAHHLRRVALRGVRGPDVQVVAHLRRQEPAREGQEELVELEVLALLDGLGVAERVLVGRVQSLLVQVARVADEPDVDLALLPGDDPEASVGDVLQRLRLLLASTFSITSDSRWPTTNSALQPSETQMPLSS